MRGNNGFIGAGYKNRIEDAENSAIAGGYLNRIFATGDSCEGTRELSLEDLEGDTTLGEGTIEGLRALYGGGEKYGYDFIGAGAENKICTGYNGIVAGSGNEISGYAEFIGSGMENRVESAYGFIGAGYGNYVSSSYASVVGGSHNSATGVSAVICNGDQNKASNNYAFIGGGRMNKVNGAYSSVVGGIVNIASGFSSSIVGGGGNKAQASHSFVGGGAFNNVGSSSMYGFIGAGRQNTVDGMASSIVGGGNNYVDGDFSIIGGGFADTLKGPYSGIFSGYNNKAGDGSDDTAAVILGGSNNTISGKYSAILGGKDNTVLSNYSLAFGEGVNVTNGYTAVFYDASNPGRVGVNTETPRTALEVNGQVTIGDGTGIVGHYYTLPNVDGSAGQVLITDGSGNVNWETMPPTPDDDWAGAGSGGMHPAHIGDFVGIGTEYPHTVLDVEGSRGCEWGFDPLDCSVGYFVNYSYTQNSTAIYGECWSTEASGRGYGGYFRGGNTGVYGEVRICEPPDVPVYGVKGVVNSTECWDDGGEKYGVYGESWNGDWNYGVCGKAIGGTIIMGLYGLASSDWNEATCYGAKAEASGGGTNYGVYASASGGFTNWAGYFAQGDVYIQNKLGIGTVPTKELEVNGTVKITHFLELTPLPSLPSPAGYPEGTVIVAPDAASNMHIWCLLGGIWKQLD